MIQNNFKIKLLIISILFNYHTTLSSQIIILSDCKTIEDGFIKNEYILDLEKSLMTRNYIYDSKTYKKYRMTDINIQKENSIERFIYQEKDFILTEKIGYPQFYTQLFFKKDSTFIKLKTVINEEEGTSKISTCKKVEIFDNES